MQTRDLSTVLEQLLGVLAQVNAHPGGLDFTLEQLTPRLVELHWHQARRELDYMGLEAQLLQRSCRLESQQATSHHHAHFGCGRSNANFVQVLERAVHVNPVQVFSRNRWHEGVRPGGQHQRVIRNGKARGPHRFSLAVQLEGLFRDHGHAPGGVIGV